MRLTKIAPLAGMAVAVRQPAHRLRRQQRQLQQARSGRRSGAPCPLVNAADPGNSKAPSGVPAADNAPKLAKKSSYTVAFSQNASNNPWRLAETASMKERGGQAGHPADRHRRQQPAVQADRRHQGPDRPEARRPVHRPDHRAARQRRQGRRHGEHPGLPPRPRRRPRRRQARPGLRQRHPVRLRPGGQAGRGADGQGHRRQRQDHRARGHHRRVAGDRPQEGLRRGHQAVPRHAGRGVAGRRLHPRQGPVGRRDPAAVAPGRHRHLRAQRRDGPRRDRGSQGHRQGSPARTSRSSRSTARRTA